MVALAERRRKHLITTTADNFTGCRCCFDPNSDGGEYGALTELRQQRKQQQQHEKEEEIENGDRKEHEEEKKVESQPIVEESFNNNATTQTSDSDSDDEFDYLLDEDFGGGGGDSVMREAEERRRAELEMALLSQQIIRQHGYGVHRQMHPSRVLRAAGLGGDNTAKRAHEVIAPAAVLHLVDPESVASASLDLFLEELAGDSSGDNSNDNNNTNNHHSRSRYGNVARGTKFMRSGGRSTLLMDAELAGKVLPRLQPDRDLPALVAIRDGVVVNVCPRLSGLTTDPMTDEVDTDAVFQWLDRSGVLLSQPPMIDEVCRIRPEEEALMDYLQNSNNHQVATQVPEEERYDCGNPMCHKSFPHEHVGMKNDEQSGLVVSEQEILGDTD